MTHVVDMRPVKTKALSFPEPVRTLILAEPDTLPVAEFIAKVGTWERLLEMEVAK